MPLLLPDRAVRKERQAWVPLTVGLVIAVLGQAISGSVGLAIGYAVVLVLLVGCRVAQGRRPTSES